MPPSRFIPTRWLLRAVCLAVCLEVWAGVGAAAFGQTNAVPFRRLSIEDGLSQSTVYAIAQDDAGFLWLGTQDGLNRYDGHHFVVFEPDGQDPDALAAGWAAALAFDADGALWVGTHGGGLDRFHPETGTFAHFRPDADDPDALPHGIVSDLHRDRAGRLWVATYGGLSRRDPGGAGFVTYRHGPEDARSLGSDRALVLAETPDGTLWVGTDGGGLNRYDPATDGFVRLRHDRGDPNSLAADIVLALHATEDGTLWIGTTKGLDRFEPRTGQFTSYRHDPADAASLSADRVNALTEDADGILWVGTDGGGLDRLDPATGRLTRFRHDPADPRSLGHDVVTALFEDRSGALWVGTAGGGLSLKTRFTHVRHDPADPASLSPGQVFALLEAADGTVWAGTDGGGLNRFDPHTGTVTRFRHNPRDPGSLCHDRVLGLEADTAGRLWVATGGGLCLFDEATGRFTRFRHDPDAPNSLTDDRVFFVYESPSAPGTLWVGTWNGLNQFDPQSGHFTHFRHDPNDPATLSNNRIISVEESRDGSLWIGTFGGGLNRFDPQSRRFARFRHAPDDPASLAHDLVATIHEAADGTLWIGTAEGLDRFDPATETFAHFTRRDGLPNNTVYGLLEDPAGRLWLTTNKGLSLFDPALGTFANYEVADGLQSNEFGQGAYHRGPSGRMYVGGIGGFNLFDPAELTEAPPPPVALTALRRGETRTPLLDAPDALTLGPADDPVTFEFAALDFAAPAHHRFAFRLDGIDDDWRYRGADQRFATYAALPGGTYTFRVKATTRSGAWAEPGTAVTLTVIPPVWRRWWFRLLVGLMGLGLVGGAAYGWHRARLRRVEAAQAEQAEIQRRLTESREAERRFLAQELHDGAVQDLYGIRFHLGALDPGDADATDALAEGRTMLQDVVAKLRVICGELRPPALAPFGLARALTSHAERFGELHPHLTLTLALDDDGQTLPQPYRLALYRIYQEAMNNLVRHAEATHVAVRLTLDAAYVTLEVEDDGRGFVVPEKWIDFGRKEHYGLLGLAERAEGIGGTFTVTSAPGGGTTVRVAAPRPTVSAAPEAKREARSFTTREA